MQIFGGVGGAIQIIVDYLVVAGGGGGGNLGGGGGAGGFRSTVTATGGGGSLESALKINGQLNSLIIFFLAICSS